MTHGAGGGARGAYGLRLAGIEDASDGLLDVPAEWPLLEIRRRLLDGDGGDAPPPRTIVRTDESATVWILDGGRVEVTREPLVATVVTAAPLPGDAVIHPYLALPGAFANRWLGRQVLHGGAFLHDGRAWAVLADKGGGKSTTLAALLQRGKRVLTDDLIVVDGATLLAGPRSIDLRRDAAGVLGGESVGFLGSRSRWRLRPGAVPAETPLGGFVHLEWGERLAIERPRAADHLPSLLPHVFGRLQPADQLGLLDLAGLPSWRFVRSGRLDELQPGLDELLAALSG